jgi:hypothetical protein
MKLGFSINILKEIKSIYLFFRQPKKINREIFALIEIGTAYEKWAMKEWRDHGSRYSL